MNVNIKGLRRASLFWYGKEPFLKHKRAAELQKIHRLQWAVQLFAFAYAAEGINTPPAWFMNPRARSGRQARPTRCE